MLTGFGKLAISSLNMTGKSEENGNKIEFDTIFVGNKQAD